MGERLYRCDSCDWYKPREDMHPRRKYFFLSCYRLWHKEYYNRNKSKVLSEAKVYYEKNKERISTRRKNSRASLLAYERKYTLKREYGLTVQQYDEMVAAQNGRCAICGTDKPGGRSGARWSVDHCHHTSKVRGLLCGTCNFLLGHAKDNEEILASAITYLRKHQVITTAKPFSWSYSRLKGFEACPKKHWHVDIVKDVKEEESENLKWGNTVHKALAARVGKKTPLPHGLEEFEQIASKVESIPGTVQVEQQFAVREDFCPTTWFARDVWMRSIADVLVLNPPVAFAIDYKLGKVLEDSQQLGLIAACVFAHHPDIHAVRTEFWWLKEGMDVTSREDFRRANLPTFWKGLWPRIEALKHAHETQSYPAKPGGLCRRWCPIRSCPHYGEG